MTCEQLNDGSETTGGAVWAWSSTEDDADGEAALRSGLPESTVLSELDATGAGGAGSAAAEQCKQANQSVQFAADLCNVHGMRAIASGWRGQISEVAQPGRKHEIEHARLGSSAVVGTA